MGNQIRQSEINKFYRAFNNDANCLDFFIKQKNSSLHPGTEKKRLET